MPSELQQTRYDQLVRRVGGIVGPGSKVSEVLSELFPVISVEDLPAELQVLGGTVIGFGATGSSGAAGESPKAQLFNPVASGKIVTVTRVDVGAGTGIIRYGIEGSSRGTLVETATVADSRLGIDARTTAQIFFQSSVGESLHTGRVRVKADEPFTLRSEKGLFVLAPGTGVTFNSETIASTLNFSCMWRERVAEASELNF